MARPFIPRTEPTIRELTVVASPSLAPLDMGRAIARIIDECSDGRPEEMTVTRVSVTVGKSQ